MAKELTTEEFNKHQFVMQNYFDFPQTVKLLVDYFGGNILTDLFLISRPDTIIDYIFNKYGFTTAVDLTKTHGVITCVLSNYANQVISFSDTDERYHEVIRYKYNVIPNYGCYNYNTKDFIMNKIDILNNIEFDFAVIDDYTLFPLVEKCGKVLVHGAVIDNSIRFPNNWSLCIGRKNEEQKDLG